MLIPVAEITIGDRLRKTAREEAVRRLAESIAAIGLQHPISVWERAVVKEDGVHIGTGYELVAGLHRLEAHKSLGLVEIEATVLKLADAERQLWEIDENLCRADLNALEQGEHLLKRQEIYEWWHPETKRSANIGPQRQFVVTDTPSFAEDTQAKTGIDKRTVQRSTRRAKEIATDVRDRIRENEDIADSGVELDALAGMKEGEQRKAVALVEAGQADSIRHAKKLMEPKKPKVQAHFKTTERAREARRNAFEKALNKLAPEDQKWAEDMVSQFFDAPVADNAAALRVVS